MMILRSASLVAAFAPFDPMSLRPPCMLVSTGFMPHQHTKLWSCLSSKLAEQCCAGPYMQQVVQCCLQCDVVPGPTCAKLCER